jgi:lactate 2-monooxygenase
VTDPVFRSSLARPPEEDMGPALARWRQVVSDPSLTWADLAWLREHTRLPLVLKGILHAEDARRAIDAGADAIVVSNHGGRQLDGEIGTMDALPPVVEAVAGRIPVLMDSGIRGGADVVKALALGARAVLLGRAWVWGLAVGGADGVAHALRCFLADYDIAVALSGHARPSELDREVLRHL